MEYENILESTIKLIPKNKETEKRGKVLFIDASDQIRVGRAQNFLEPEHIQKIHNWYCDYKNVENYVKVASMEELEENDFNLNIPLYIEKIIEDNLPTVEKAMDDLKLAWKSSLEAEDKFKKILKEFIFHNELLVVFLIMI